MDSSSQIRMQCLCLRLSVIVYAFIIPTLSANSSSKPQKLVLKLIHRHSIYPPKYPPDSSLSDRINIALTSSYTNPQKPLAPVVPTNRGNSFWVNISIGNPPIHQLVTMDTGSDLLWVQCQPCTRCQNTGNPIYDPKKSNYFFYSKCYERYCDQVPGGSCDLVNKCEYTMRYGDGSNSTGLLGYETLTFNTPDKQTTEIPGVIFGCGTDNFNIDPLSDGVFGLGGQEISISKTVGGKFSYCIGNVSDRNYEYNLLALGNDAYFLGNSVPFQLFDGHYYISLEGMSFGGTEIPMNPKDFEFNVIIDSGATLSYFKKEVFETIKSLVQKEIGQRLKQVNVGSRYDLLCYKGNVRTDLGYFPTLTLRLGPGTEISLAKDGLFWSVPNLDLFCLSIRDPGSRKENMIGIVAQQYYNVGFDLNAMEVFFKRKECELLDLEH